jgi:hypothetical protein
MRQLLSDIALVSVQGGTSLMLMMTLGILLLR